MAGAGEVVQLQTNRTLRLPFQGLYEIVEVRQCLYGGSNRCAAAYVVPEDIWFIIPLEALNNAIAFVIHTYPRRNLKNRGQHRAHDFEPYREAWWILGGEKSAGAKAGG